MGPFLEYHVRVYGPGLALLLEARVEFYDYVAEILDAAKLHGHAVQVTGKRTKLHITQIPQGWPSSGLPGSAER